MARRNHLTAVGSVACDDLESVGAGEREGWLADHANVIASLHGRSLLALASQQRSLVLVLSWDPHSSSSSSVPSPVKIRPHLSASDGKITAVEWIPIADLLALALGTSAGFLLIYSPDGDLIHKQIIHPARVLRLTFRETKAKFSQDTPSEELCVVMPGVIARFDGSDIQSLLQRWFQEARSRTWENMKDPEDESSFGRISYQLWNVNKFGSCADAAIVGLMPPPLLELQLLLLLGSQVSVTTVQLP